MEIARTTSDTMPKALYNSDLRHTLASISGCYSGTKGHRAVVGFDADGSVVQQWIEKLLDAE